MKLIFLSALLQGVQNNDLAAVDRLLRYDNVGRKNFNVNGSLYESLLHAAAHNNNYEICKTLLKFGADVNIFNFESKNPLNVAERNVNWSICKLFIKRRKRKEKRILYKKALHICAKKDDLVMSNVHIKSCNVNEEDEKGRTPLHVAMVFARDELCELLLKHGVDVNAKDSYNDSPVQLALYHGRHKLRENFLQNMAYFG